MKSSWTDVVTAIAAAAASGAAVAALLIPWRIEEAATDTRTLVLMNDLNREIAGIVTEKNSLDKKNCEDNNIWCEKYFSYSYISNHSKVEAQVFRLLNEYDFICLGGNAERFNNDLINRIRGNALSKTWKQYGKYIEEYRKEKDPDAWIECDEWLKRVQVGTERI